MTCIVLELSEKFAEVAQLVEQLTRNEQVAGSIPVFGSIVLPLEPGPVNLYTYFICIYQKIISKIALFLFYLV